MNVAELREAMRASRTTIVISVPGFGDVSLRSLDVTNGLRMMELAAAFVGKTNPTDMADYWVELLALSIVDENGKQAFNDDDGREVIRGIRIDRLTKLGNAAVSLNGMTDDEVDETGDAKKNET